MGKSWNLQSAPPKAPARSYASAIKIQAHLASLLRSLEASDRQRGDACKQLPGDPS